MAERKKPGRGAAGGPGELRVGSYDDWTADGLRQRAKELGLSGYSGLKKPALVVLLRRHRGDG